MNNQILFAIKSLEKRVVNLYSKLNVAPGAPAGDSRPYKVYTALLTQSGITAPTVTVLENTLGGTIVWARTGAGLYYGTLENAFITGKTFYSAVSTAYVNSNVRVYGYISNVSQVRLDTYFLDTPSDGILTTATIEIRVYN
jgi:hypothetical protein